MAIGEIEKDPGTYQQDDEKIVWILTQYELRSTYGGEKASFVKNPPENPRGRNIHTIVKQLEKIGYNVASIYLRSMYDQDLRACSVDEIEENPEEEYYDFRLEFGNGAEGNIESLTLEREHNGDGNLKPRYNIILKPIGNVSEAETSKLLKIVHKNAFDYDTNLTEYYKNQQNNLRS